MNTKLLHARAIGCDALSNPRKINNIKVRDMEMNQILKSKFGCSIGDRAKLSPIDTKWGVGIVKGYIPPCEEDEQDYVSIDFEDLESHDHQENLWLRSGEFTLIQL